MIRHLLLIAVSVFIFVYEGITQDCQLPIVTSIDNPATDGFTVHWIDNNSAVLNYEIEIGRKGFTRSFSPNIPTISDDSVRLSNLLSGSTYEIYLRSVCSADNISPWNGPYFYNTIIDNNASCDLLLDIPDDNCPDTRKYLIEVDVDDSYIIGLDYNIRSIDLNIEHTWPPDLQISLTSPSGETALLSEYNGNGRDNYGSPDNNDCRDMAIFTDDACLSIAAFPPPLLGEFRPLDNLRNTFDGIPASGIWTIEVCDRASGDIGQIKAVKLNFTESICIAPEEYVIDDIEADNISVSWLSADDCTIYKIAYRIVSAPLAQTSFDFVECNENSYSIENLVPDTEYVMTITTRCNNGVESPETCETFFRTACANSTMTTSFNESTPCPISCDDICETDSIWYNLPGQSNAWIVATDNTPSEFTGPSGDINGKGNYIYVENNNPACHTDTVVLESKCLELNGSTSCHLTFYYHMYGGEITSLELQQNIQAKGWTNIWSQAGNQGDVWIAESISLSSEYDVGQLRFVAYRSGDIIRNDIAIDQIKIIGLDTFPLRKYYADLDGDSFGDTRNFRLLCSTEAPSGFVTNDDDCNDDNPNINPNATEISCNLIDENCNGNADDNQATDLNYQLLSISDESCKGRKDGSIELIANNGQTPYTYSWSNGESGPILSNIGTGIYTCTISDIGTCQIITDPIFVDFENLINYSLLSLTPPTCQGLDNGSATLLISGGVPPYDIHWASGINGSQVSNLTSGTYVITITDGSSCTIESEPITVTGRQAITAGVALSRDVDCSGDNNGIIQLGISGGTPPYNVLWNNGLTTPTITQLSQGQYSVTITDILGCSNTIDDIRINEPDKLSVIINNKENLNCPDDNTGMIDVSVDGGTAPYSYFWSTGQRTEDLININAGNYSITVTDFNACFVVLEDINIIEPDPISVDIDNIINVNCPTSEDGYIKVQVDGGQPNYSYNWSVLDGIESQSNELSELNPGLYSLTVVDEFGCKSDPLFFEIVNRNRAINIETTALTLNQCFGDSTASIVATVNNGTVPFDYNWSNGDRQLSESPQDTIVDLITSSYTLTVTDSEGCTGVSELISLSEPEELVYDVINIVENECWYENQASISIEISGGTVNKTILWNNGSSGSLITELNNGQYQATITDDNNCTKVTNLISLTSHQQIEIDAIIKNTNSNNGTIDITPTAGLSPFSYTWDGPISLPPLPMVENLIPGEYTLKVADREGCVLDTTFTIQLINSVDNDTDYTITLFPNPGSGTIAIRSEKTIKNINVYNLSGQSVSLQKRKDYGTEIEFNINSKVHGIYYIEITTDDTIEIIPYLLLGDY